MIKKVRIPWDPKGSKRPEITGEKNVNWKGGEITKQCVVCKKKFKIPPCLVKRGRGKFCSIKCKGIFQEGKPSKARGKKHPTAAGINNSNWQGGKYKHTKGYVYTYAPNHPHKIARNYYLEHRLVVEQQIGRYLSPGEEVHHLGKKGDNKPKMLVAFVSHSAHLRFEKNPKDVKLEEIIFDGRKLH